MPLQSWTYRNHESMNMYLFAREQSVWESTYMLLKHKKGLLFQSIQRFYKTRPPKLFVCVFNNHLSFQYQITWHGQWYCHVVCRNSFKLPRHPSSSLTHGTGCFIGLKVVFFQNNASLSPHTYTQINTYIYCPHAHIRSMLYISGELPLMRNCILNIETNKRFKFLFAFYTVLVVVWSSLDPRSNMDMDGSHLNMQNSSFFFGTGGSMDLLNSQ